jgi:predicted RNA-binding Zn-ribbon protein involved in translation (DUF1610 family)
MMKKLDIKKTDYTIDIATIEGDGSFPCPRCGIAISPDDESDRTYQILDTKVINDELSELIISCGKCRSIIRIIGFLQGFDA